VTIAALVPMKGHSERVPGKNLRVIAGRPLFHWITQSLLEAQSVDEVIIDTDSDIIESEVRAAFPDVSIHRRPESLHGDMVPMHDIVSDVARGLSHDLLLQTHSTNPLLRPGTIDRAIADFREPGDHDSLMGVTVWLTRFYFGDGTPINHDPTVLQRTQDLAPIFEENSNLYIAPTEMVVAWGRRIGPHPKLFAIPREEAVDIDEELDFLIAEFLLARHV
jgi:CMP-N-acetylneuraminic acid synthetase